MYTVVCLLQVRELRKIISATEHELQEIQVGFGSLGEPLPSLVLEVHCTYTYIIYMVHVCAIPASNVSRHIGTSLLERGCPLFGNVNRFVMGSDKPVIPGQWLFRAC